MCCLDSLSLITKNCSLKSPKVKQGSDVDCRCLTRVSQSGPLKSGHALPRVLCFGWDLSVEQPWKSHFQGPINEQVFTGSCTRNQSKLEETKANYSPGYIVSVRVKYFYKLIFIAYHLQHTATICNKMSFVVASVRILRAVHERCCVKLDPSDGIFHESLLLNSLRPTCIDVYAIAPTWKVPCSVNREQTCWSHVVVAACLRSGTSLIRVRVCTAVRSFDFMNAARWKTGVSFPSSFLPLLAAFLISTVDHDYTDARNYAHTRSIEFYVFEYVCVCVWPVEVDTWAN